MSEERPKSAEAKYLQMILGALFVGFLTFQGWLASQVNSINDRLTRIEATIERNKDERNDQLRLRDSRIDDIADRLRALEGARSGTR